MDGDPSLAHGATPMGTSMGSAPQAPLAIDLNAELRSRMAQEEAAASTELAKMLKGGGGEVGVPDDGFLPMVDQSGIVQNVPNTSVKQAIDSGLSVADPKRLEMWDAQSAGGAITMIRDGQLFDVPKDHLDEAANEGARVANQDEIDWWDKQNPVVFVRNADGRIDAMDRKDAAKQGLQKASEEELAAEFGDAGSMAATGAEAFAQGLTTHVYKPVAGLIGGDTYLAEMEQRERFNPRTAIAGEIGGALAQAIATQGAGLGNVARTTAVKMAATQGTARGVATRIAGEAIAGAVDGAAFGTAQRLADSLTGDHPVDAETLLMGAGQDALFGAALGGGFGAVGEGVKGAVKGAQALGEWFSKRELGSVLAGRTVPEAIDVLADKAMFKAVLGGSNKGAARKAAKQFGVDGDAVLGKWASENQIPLHEGQGTVVESLEAINQVSRETQHNLVGQLDATNIKPDLDNLAANVTDFFDGLKAKAVTEGAAKKAMNNAEFKPILNAIMKNEGEVTFNDLWKMRQKIDDLGRFDANVSNGVNEVFKDLRRVVEDQFISMADEAATKLPMGSFDIGGWQTAWQKAKTDTRFSAFLADAARSGLAGQQGNNVLTLRGAMAGLAGGNLGGQLVGDAAGAMAGGLVGGPLGALVTGVAAEQIAKHGPRMKVNALRGLAEIAKSDGTAKLARGAVKAKDMVGTAARRAEDALLRGPRVPDEDEKEYSTLNEAAVSKEVERAQQVAANDGAAADQLDDVTDAIAQHYGLGIADALNQRVKSSSQFLVDKIAAKVPPASINRTVAAMKSPGTALKRLADGRASKEEVEVVRNLYPKAFSDLQKRVARTLADTSKPVNRKVAARLKRLLDMDDTDPQQIAFWQQQAAASAGQDQAGGGGGGPTANVNAGLSSPSSTNTLQKR